MATSASDRWTVRSLFREYTLAIVDNAIGELTSQIDVGRAFAVIDAHVFDAWADDLRPLTSRVPHVSLAAREESKTMDAAQKLLEQFVEARVRKDFTIVVVGGGVTQDVAAFAASLAYRGLSWAFIPTTLLAQCDSCLGSKTSINLGDKKNLVGNYWPPSFAFIDTRFLKTLDVGAIHSGIGEMLHFYLYAGSSMAERIVANIPALLAERSQMRPFIRESLRIKQRVAELDEFDQGERHKFNYGHTFGHALESISEFTIPHGLAVTVGMDIANFISRRLGLMPERTFDELHALLAKNFPARSLGDVDVEKYIGYLSRDKKNVSSAVSCILARAAGSLVEHRLENDARLREFLTDYFAGALWPRANGEGVRYS